jgi:hypothetical protein
MPYKTKTIRNPYFHIPLKGFKFKFTRGRNMRGLSIEAKGMELKALTGRRGQNQNRMARGKEGEGALRSLEKKEEVMRNGMELNGMAMDGEEWHTPPPPLPMLNEWKCRDDRRRPRGSPCVSKKWPMGC